MESITLEQIITVSVLCVWFLFPLGILVSFMYQDRHQRYPKITQTHKKKHQPEYHRNFIFNDVDADGEFHEHDVEIPVIPPHQIPKKPGHVHNNWKT
jgi:hypothetical protein